jgi:hypothetical protein
MQLSNREIAKLRPLLKSVAFLEHLKMDELDRLLEGPKAASDP